MSGAHLKAGQLGTVDVTASTVANIGPGIDFYFAFGVIAVTAGVAAPLTILAGAVAVVLLAFIVAEFTKAEPSAGSFITYVETSLGARAGVATALLVAVGFTVAIAGVFTMSGGMVALTLAHYTSWHPPWEPLSLVLTVGAIWLTARGVRLSTSAVGLAVVLQVAIMLVVCVVDPRRPARAPLGHAVLLGSPQGRPGRPVRGLPARSVHVHRLGKRSGPRRGVPRSEAHRPESPVHIDRDRHRTLRSLRLRDGLRLRLRRLFDRSLIGPVPGRGRPLPRYGGPVGVARRHRLRARRPGRRRELPGPHAVRRRPERAPTGATRSRPRSPRTRR